MPKHHFIKFGEGKEILFCFHGYEQDCSMFQILGDDWRKKYTIYAFDLLFHGKTVFPKERLPNKPILEEEIKTYFDDFFKDNSIEKFETMGYSLGARFSLFLVHLFPDKVNGVYLFAPDGFKKMPLQNFIEHNTFGVFLFRSFVKKPASFHFSVKVLRKSRIIRKRLHDFVLRKTSSLEQREQLYSSWQAYKTLHLSTREINKLAADVSKFHLIFGEFDAVIPVSNLKSYSIKSDQIISLKKGHDLFDEDALKTLQSRLNF